MSSPTNPNMAADLPPIGLRRVVYLQANRPPTVLDSKYRDGSYYEFNTEWRDLSKTPPQIWKLATINSKIDAIWFLLGPGSGPPPSGPALQFTPSSGIVVFPNISTGNVNVFGGTGITVTGTTETLTIALSGSAPAAIETITGDDGTPESPSSNNFNLLGAVVANGTHAKPVYVLGSAATETVQVQRSAASATTDTTSQGLASFSSSHFSVDANGWTDAKVANAVAPTPANANLAGIAQFDNTQFTVDSHGFVQLAISGAFNSIVQQSFAASGTYTPTAGMKYCIVELVGGGGGGGGVDATGSGLPAGGAGGGGGGYSRVVLTAAQIGGSQTVTIGAGASGGVGATGGGTGGTTSLGTLCSATGGSGGQGNASSTGNATVASGGAAGVGTTTTAGKINTVGGGGGSSVCFNIGGALGGFVGYGGSSYFCGNIEGTAGVTGSSNGLAGTGYGCGGGGAVAFGAAATNGGAGFDGFCLVTEFI